MWKQRAIIAASIALYLALVSPVGFAQSMRPNGGASGSSTPFTGGTLTSSLVLDATNSTCADALSLTFSGDTNMGLQRSAADTLLVCLAGATAGTWSATVLTLAADLAVNGGDITTSSTGTVTVFNTNAAAADILGAATGAVTIAGGSASTGCTVTGNTGAFACSAGGTFTNVTATGSVDVQSVIRNTAGANVEIDESNIRGTAALTITTQNNGDVTLGPGGTGDVVLTPGTVGRVELNTVTLTALAATLCDTDAEVGHMYKVSANAGAEIQLCVCGKAASAYSFFPLVAGGDCVP